MLTNEQNHENPSQRRQTLGILASPVEDKRLPPPDVFGYLADRLIQRQDLEFVAEHVREAWPQVTSVRCGVYDDKPYFSIHIHPFSKAAQRDHWPLGEWIRMALHTKDCRFFFLPPMEDESFCSETTVYQNPARKPGNGEPQAA